ncbi:hypothetical protein VTJ04DRAFT_6012 [Mycothermus thermophilus]|uniref:uncharacterized protein n=1 Tax=Humicola insolens TaxID=85995 RepID=UPI0037421A28
MAIACFGEPSHLQNTRISKPSSPGGGSTLHLSMKASEVLADSEQPNVWIDPTTAFASLHALTGCAEHLECCPRTWSAEDGLVGIRRLMAGLQRQMQMGDMTAYKPISPRLDISITASIHGINYTAPISTTPARHPWPTSLVCAGPSRNRRNRDASSHRLFTCTVSCVSGEMSSIPRHVRAP